MGLVSSYGTVLVCTLSVQRVNSDVNASKGYGFQGIATKLSTVCSSMTYKLSGSW